MSSVHLTPSARFCWSVETFQISAGKSLIFYGMFYHIYSAYLAQQLTQRWTCGGFVSLCDDFESLGGSFVSFCSSFVSLYGGFVSFLVVLSIFVMFLCLFAVVLCHFWWFLSRSMIVLNVFVMVLCLFAVVLCLSVVVVGLLWWFTI